MTDTTIRPKRNYHKISTGILIASAVLLSLGGAASAILKPSGYLAFEPLTFGGQQAAQVDGSNLASDEKKFVSDKKLAEAKNPPLPAEKPPVPPKAQ